jgi:hypothetical protein
MFIRVHPQWFAGICANHCGSSGKVSGGNYVVHTPSGCGSAAPWFSVRLSTAGFKK